MVNKIKHHKFFFNALRTMLIFIASFLTYELLKIIESKLNEMYPNNRFSNYANRKACYFVLIFISDLLILYLIALLFDVHL